VRRVVGAEDELGIPVDSLGAGALAKVRPAAASTTCELWDSVNGSLVSRVGMTFWPQVLKVASIGAMKGYSLTLTHD
jgi:hypothetical protein